MRERKSKFKKFLWYLAIFIIAVIVASYLIEGGIYEDLKNALNIKSRETIEVVAISNDCPSFQLAYELSGESKSTMARLFCSVECPSGTSYFSYRCEKNNLICICEKNEK